jgi:tetratricopeptide (TPR) repeat protein
MFKEIIEDYSDGDFAHFALQELLRIERVLEIDFYELQAYYNNLDNTQYSPETVHKIDYLANYCNILNEDYELAIDWYEDIMANEPTFTDSIYVQIDLGYIYLLMEIEGRGVSYRSRFPELIPENRKVYTIRKQELIDLFYGMKENIEDDFEEDVIPSSTQLFSNYPNPFNPVTNICFDLSENSDVSLMIYNIKGQKVCKIHDGILEPGNYRYQWSGENNKGRQVASGVYFYRLVSGNYTKTRKMLLLK